MKECLQIQNNMPNPTWGPWPNARPDVFTTDSPWWAKERERKKNALV